MFVVFILISILLVCGFLRLIFLIVSGVFVFYVIVVFVFIVLFLYVCEIGLGWWIGVGWGFV